MMIFRLFAYCTTAILTLIILWLAGWMWFAASVASMHPQDTKTKTDAIIVLTGGDKRVNTGLDLINKNLAKEIFISGVNQTVKPRELISLWGKNGSKIEDKITLGYMADSTATNATESQEWVKKNDIHSIRLVTSNYHMMRSMLNFHKALPDVIIIEHPVVPDNFEPWKEQFWPLTFSEYNKLLATWLRFDLNAKNPSLKDSGTL